MNLPETHLAEFAEIKRMIDDAKHKAIAVVDSTTIDLYWKVGCYVHDRLKKSSWGDGVVVQLSAWLRNEEPGITGFTSSNIHRMVKFVEIYSAPDFLTAVKNNCSASEDATVSPLLPGKAHNVNVSSKVATPSPLLQQNNNQYVVFITTLLRQISWSNLLLIIAGRKSTVEGFSPARFAISWIVTALI